MTLLYSFSIFVCIFLTGVSLSRHVNWLVKKFFFCIFLLVVVSPVVSASTINYLEMFSSPV